jgi:hypothetical protein
VESAPRLPHPRPGLPGPPGVDIPQGLSFNEFNCPSSVLADLTEPLNVFASFQHMHQVPSLCVYCAFSSSAFSSTPSPGAQVGSRQISTIIRDGVTLPLNEVEFYQFAFQQTTAVNTQIQVSQPTPAPDMRARHAHQRAHRDTQAPLCVPACTLEKLNSFPHLGCLSLWCGLQPGDELRTLCVFNNGRGVDVQWGEASNEEMCLDFLYYYPSVSSTLSRCGTGAQGNMLGQVGPVAAAWPWVDV